VPVRITARTSLSRSAFSRRLVNWSSIGREIVFMRSGRFSVMVAIWSATA